mmetsp:Transcript_20436/g.49137  ORF Transcript_20436/g.49137 Transcript_20436/m.49137 type:complete len:223 (-) Transcript_20436:759-1427(-)
MDSIVLWRSVRGRGRWWPDRGPHSVGLGYGRWSGRRLELALQFRLHHALVLEVRRFAAVLDYTVQALFPVDVVGWGPLGFADAYPVRDDQVVSRGLLGGLLSGGLPRRWRRGPPRGHSGNLHLRHPTRAPVPHRAHHGPLVVIRHTTLSVRIELEIPRPLPSRGIVGMVRAPREVGGIASRAEIRHPLGTLARSEGGVDGASPIVDAAHAKGHAGEDIIAAD